MALINLRNGMMGGRPTAESYVQDGLVAMWDGIENAGWGVHNPNATTWKDLTENHTLTTYGTLNWGDNYAYFDGSTYLSGNSPKIKNSINTNAITIEFIVRPIRHGNSVNCGYLGLCEDVRGFWIWDNANSKFSSWAWRVDGYSELNIQWVVGQQIFRGIVEATPSICTLSIADKTRSSSNVGFVNNDTIEIGRIGNFGMAIFNAFAIRVYSRALTAAEIAANHAIDKARFNLPDAT